MGINYVRPPTLKITKVKNQQEPSKYTTYKIKTKHVSTSKDEGNDDLFTNYLDSFIYCNDEIILKKPTKKYSINKSKRTRKHNY